MTGSRDVAAVLDARIRQQAGNIAPAPWRPWSERVPETSEPERQELLTEIAAAMDGRMARLGEHTAETAPAWATNALGAVPDEPGERAAWTERASYLAGYRELTSYEHPSEPIGPEHVNSPEARGLWFAAYSAMTRTDEAGLDRLTDGQLHLRRAAYAAETAWAPQYAGMELRLARGRC